MNTNEITQDDEIDMARRLEWERRQSTLKQKKEKEGAGVNTIEDAQKTINRLKNIYRFINGTTAVTFVGLIVPFLLMNAQLIFGNFFKVKFVPALSLIEIFILGIVDLIIFIALLIITIIIYFIVNPCELSGLVGTWWADILGKVCKGAKEVIEATK